MTLSGVEGAALQWWRNKAPAGYDDKAHYTNFAINCSTNAEINLAREVARMCERMRMESFR